jgi:hypothetical protein
MKTSNYFAATILFLMPAVSVELLSGNTPLASYIMPINFVILNIIYGGAVLLIRETVVRWDKGFASVLMLAAGYGMLNEAVGTKGFFDPHFYAVVIFGLEGFGRAFGINVPWALNISVVHAVFSIVIPITLISAIFPGKERWIGDKIYAALLIAFIAVNVFVFKVFIIAPSYYHYNEGPGPILLILALMITVIVAAWKMPSKKFSNWNVRLNTIALFIVGVVFTSGFIILPDHVRKMNSPVVYDLFLLIFFVAVPILSMIKLPAPSPRGKVALAAGIISPWILLGIGEGTPGTVFAVSVVLIVLAAAFLRAGWPPFSISPEASRRSGPHHSRGA